jgi:hypothetical protein
MMYIYGQYAPLNTLLDREYSHLGSFDQRGFLQTLRLFTLTSWFTYPSTPVEISSCYTYIGFRGSNVSKDELSSTRWWPSEQVPAA